MADFFERCQKVGGRVQWFLVAACEPLRPAPAAPSCVPHLHSLHAPRLVCGPAPRYSSIQLHLHLAVWCCL